MPAKADNFVGYLHKSELYMYRKTFISSGSLFEDQIGYSRAVIAGDMVFVSGTTGYDYTSMTIASDIGSQAE